MISVVGDNHISASSSDSPSRHKSRDELSEDGFAADANMSAHAKVAMTLSNSIIGVSILAMPFCMKQCGIILGTLMLVISSMVTRFTCHLLLKSAVISRRKSFEFVAYHTFGSIGKLAAEINIIGFMLGILISFFVVIGDLGPEIICKTFNVENTGMLRTCVLLILGFTVALPLSMLKEVDTLAQISALSILFYVVLALKTIAEAIPVMSAMGWADKIVLWNPSGILQSLPIFALALSCQTQIFEVYEALPNPSIKQMNLVIKMAVYLCTSVYLSVGIFGYISNYNKEFTGNILLSFTPGFSTDVIKFLFVLSVAMGFPLVVLPCRTSVNSLLLKKSGNPFDVGGSFIPETRFKIITFAIVTSTLGFGILCPNIEMVLGFLGSTIGVLTCIIFPAIMFTRLTSTYTFEKWGSQFVFILGLVLLASCTWVNISGPDKKPGVALLPDFKESKIDDVTFVNAKVFDDAPFVNSRLLEEKVLSSAKSKDDWLELKAGTKVYPKSTKMLPVPPKFEDKVPGKKEEAKVDIVLGLDKLENEQKRHEPPVPQEPDELAAVDNGINKFAKIDDKKENEINAEALKKEDSELEVKSKGDETADIDAAAKRQSDHEDAALEKQEHILRQLEESQKQQKKIIEEQRQILQELKEHEKSHDHDKESVIADRQSVEAAVKEEVVHLEPDVAVVSIKSAPIKRDDSVVEPVKSDESVKPQIVAVKKPADVMPVALKKGSIGREGSHHAVDIAPHRVLESFQAKNIGLGLVAQKLDSLDNSVVLEKEKTVVGQNNAEPGKDQQLASIKKSPLKVVPPSSSNETKRTKVHTLRGVPSFVAGGTPIVAADPVKINQSAGHLSGGNAHQFPVNFPLPEVSKKVAKGTTAPPPLSIPVVKAAATSNVDTAGRSRTVPAVVVSAAVLTTKRTADLDPALRKR